MVNPQQVSDQRRDRRVIHMADLEPEERAVVNALLRLRRSREEKAKQPATA